MEAALTAFHDRDYDACTKFCKAVLSRDPGNKQAYHLLLKSASFSAQIDDLEIEQERSAEDYLGVNSTTEGGRPGTSLKTAGQQGPIGFARPGSSLANKRAGTANRVNLRSSAGLGRRQGTAQGSSIRLNSMASGGAKRLGTASQVRAAALVGSTIDLTTLEVPEEVTVASAATLAVAVDHLIHAQGAFKKASEIAKKVLSDLATEDDFPSRSAWVMRLARSLQGLGLHNEAWEALKGSIGPPGAADPEAVLRGVKLLGLLDQPRAALDILLKHVDRTPTPAAKHAAANPLGDLIPGMASANHAHENKENEVGLPDDSLLLHLARLTKDLGEPASVPPPPPLSGQLPPLPADTPPSTLRFAHVLERNPLSVEALATVATQMLTSGRAEIAARLLARVAQQNGTLARTSPALWSNLGLACMAGGQHHLALPCLERALVLAKGDGQMEAEVWANVGSVAVRYLADLAFGEDAYRRALEASSEHEEAKVNLAVLRLMKLKGGQQSQNVVESVLRECEADLRTVVEKNPAHFKAQYNLALLLSGQYRLTEALKHCKAAISLDGTHVASQALHKKLMDQLLGFT